MWKKLKPNKVEDDGLGTITMLEDGIHAVAQVGFPHDEVSSQAFGTITMLEDGIRAVAQVGFPHDEVSSQAWARELASFTHTPQHISDEIMDSPELWKLKRCKATGEDGWCEELLMLLKRMGNCSFADLKML